jgi:hypothetical protein
VIFLHPREWRRFMRDYAEVHGMTRAEMRAELRLAGHTMDPWKVPLPVKSPALESFDLWLRDPRTDSREE